MRLPGSAGCRESPGPQEGLSLGTRAGAGLREHSNHTGTESLPPLGLTPSDIRWGARERCIAQGLDCPVSLQRPPVCSCPPAWEEGGGGSVAGGRSHHLRPGPGTPRVDSSAEAKAWVLELRAAGRRHCPLVATGWNERWLPGRRSELPIERCGALLCARTHLCGRGEGSDMPRPWRRDACPVGTDMRAVWVPYMASSYVTFLNLSVSPFLHIRLKINRPPRSSWSP